MLDRLFIREKIKQFLLEDIGYSDITTDNLKDKFIKAYILAKEDGILAGIDIAKEVFNVIDENINFKIMKKDGEFIKKGDIIGYLYGSGKSILKGERLSLNIIQRLSGIATNTNKYINLIKDTGVKILDTRKTTPGFRAFEKYAVKVGGGYNHRFALYDMVMIKDNHKVLAGGIKEAVNQIKEKISPMAKIEVEVNTLEELKEAMELDVDIIMLDNFDIEQVKEAVKINNKRKKLEVSGNITLQNIRDYAETGVDFISSGALVHSAKWLDISLKFL
ncbi:carboxylating nicotinate-nucleotide diphosphorylase [Venenivibrio stagnispumantis]|uniref:Probable nicotinate-nucleotide pyrophosphorylase [carboxylating] n=1 Tax=Venenivibrio stagnispumantis TaxID=407998 RepID=A0AA45WKI8_9AQUI|nr:carboxylating nicotinate-nucleotide diphosphorylase [Venenivibrio stagnispumantis]MCW4573030.1 carboxylating nicotinate-nucleotide diphosphorylase [Venenivibrio stagnispumantis]SMP07653.1 nicotinate-nucleotide pyrophosphorylase [carboxylating] [Venenivibrio stagnispumantis]